MYCLISILVSHCLLSLVYDYWFLLPSSKCRTAIPLFNEVSLWTAWWRGSSSKPVHCRCDWKVRIILMHLNHRQICKTIFCLLVYSLVLFQFTDDSERRSVYCERQGKLYLKMKMDVLTRSQCWDIKEGIWGYRLFCCCFCFLVFVAWFTGEVLKAYDRNKYHCSCAQHFLR